MFLKLAKAIREDRKSRGLTQKEYGDNIGFTASAVSSWERCESDPGGRATWALRERYKVDCGKIRRSCMD